MEQSQVYQTVIKSYCKEQYIDKAIKKNPRYGSNDAIRQTQRKSSRNSKVVEKTKRSKELKSSRNCDSFILRKR